MTETARIPSPLLGTFDPITLDMLWQRLITIMNEVDQIIVRTTFSTILSEGLDFACILPIVMLARCVSRL